MSEVSESLQADQPPAKPLRTVRHLLPLAVWTLAIVLGLWFFAAFKSVLLLVLAAAAIACSLSPIVHGIRRPRSISVTVVAIGLLSVIIAAVAIVVVLLKGPITREMEHLPDTRRKLDAALANWSQQLGVHPPVDVATIFSRVEQWLGQVGGVAMSIGGSVVGALLAASLVLIGAIYFLADSRKSLLDPALAPLPAHRRSQIEAALDELGPKLRWWLIGVLCSMTLVALISWLGYQISGIKFAVPLAIFAGLCELVPTIGPIVGGIVAIAVAGTQGTDQAVGAAITWIVVQTLESYVILPLVMRKAVEIPSIVTLFSVIFWGEVFGLPGLFLAIPLNLLIWAFYKHLVVLPREAGRHLVGVTSGTLAKAESS